MVCTFCGGRLEHRCVRVVHQDGAKVAVFENAPAKVCQRCGHRWFGIGVVRDMEERLTGTHQPTGSLQVPVYALDC